MRRAAVIVYFYQLDRAEGAPSGMLDGDMQLRCWQPDRDGWPARGSRRLGNYLWWALGRAGAFSRAGFAELRIESAGQVLQRLIVTPRWYRFPFMGPNDLQIGDVWTSPVARRRRLATSAMAEAHRRFASDGTVIWYVADASNEGSCALARSCGYRLVAVGRRTRRLGTLFGGQFVIDRFV